MEWIKPLMVAVSVYCIPVWYATEAAAVLFQQKGWRATAWGQFALRCLPAVIALVLVELSPQILVVIIEGLQGPIPEDGVGHGELCLFAVVVGAAAVQLHQWRIPQSLGVIVVSTIRRLGTDPAQKTPPKDPP